MVKLSKFQTENPQVLGAIVKKKKKKLYGDMELCISVPISHGNARK